MILKNMAAILLVIELGHIVVKHHLALVHEILLERTTVLGIWSLKNKWLLKHKWKNCRRALKVIIYVALNKFDLNNLIF